MVFIKKDLRIIRQVYDEDELVRNEVDLYQPYNSEQGGAWFFLKSKRGFVKIIYKVPNLEDKYKDKFARLFFSEMIEEKSNRLAAVGSRRSQKALNRAEIAQIVGYEKLFWDEYNWQALCKRCHDKKTMTEDRYQTFHY